MMMPTVHMNGTGKETLLNDHVDAMAAIRGAMEALRKAAPNARDYYVQGDDAYTKAREEYSARQQKLADVLDELEVIASHLADS